MIGEDGEFKRGDEVTFDLCKECAKFFLLQILFFLLIDILFRMLFLKKRLIFVLIIS
jgi:positive regulator of sigma E activity